MLMFIFQPAISHVVLVCSQMMAQTDAQTIDAAWLLHQRLSQALKEWLCLEFLHQRAGEEACQRLHDFFVGTTVSTHCSSKRSLKFCAKSACPTKRFWTKTSLCRWMSTQCWPVRLHSIILDSLRTHERNGWMLKWSCLGAWFAWMVTGSCAFSLSLTT